MTVETEELVAYCGLCCQDCFGYKGRIADLAKELRQELRQEKFDIMAGGFLSRSSSIMMNATRSSVHWSGSGVRTVAVAGEETRSVRSENARKRKNIRVAGNVTI